MKVDEAIETVVELEIARARVRDDLAHQASARVPLLLFGVLTLASALAALPGGGEWFAVYWLVAGPAGVLLVARHFRGLHRRVGIGPDGRVTLALSVGMTASVFVVGWFAGAAGAAYALGAGYLVMAAHLRSDVMAGLGAGLLAATALVDLAGVEPPEVVLPAVLGAALLLTGLVTRP